MDKFSSSESFDAFLKGYKGKTQDASQYQRSIQKDPLDVIDAFSSRDTNSLSIMEIASHLMISAKETYKLIEQLELKKILTTKTDVEGIFLVELTNLGQQLRQK